MGRGRALSLRAGLPRARRAAAALPLAPGRQPPAARRPPAAPAAAARRPPLPPALPPRDPAPPGRGAAGGKAWWGGRGSDTRGRARENKGGMCAAESPETGRRWGPVARGPGAVLPLRAYCLPSAHPHALNKKLTHPAAAYQPIDSQTNSLGLLRPGGFLMGWPGPGILSQAHPRSTPFVSTLPLISFMILTL